MDLNFYSDLTGGTGQHDDDPEFLDPQSFNGFDSDNKVTLRGTVHGALSRHRNPDLLYTPTLERLSLNASCCSHHFGLLVYRSLTGRLHLFLVPPSLNRTLNDNIHMERNVFLKNESNLCVFLQFPGGSDNYLTISGSSHPFLSSSEVGLYILP